MRSYAFVAIKAFLTLNTAPLTGFFRSCSSVFLQQQFLAVLTAVKRQKILKRARQFSAENLISNDKMVYGLWSNSYSILASDHIVIVFWTHSYGILVARIVWPQRRPSDGSRSTFKPKSDLLILRKTVS